MVDPRLIEKALDKSRPGWRERQSKRRSPWNLVCVLLGFGFAGFYWYELFQAAWALHVLIHPAHTGLQGEFWVAGISGRVFVSSFLMLLPLGVPALVCGLLTGNCVVWLIPPARRAMNAEAGGDRTMTFAGASAGLLLVGGLASVACLVLSFIGLATLTSLK